MVRTKDSSGVKTSNKASRKVTASPMQAVNKPVDKNKHSGGNPYYPRETPSWQKEITSFFPKIEENSESDFSKTSNNNGLVADKSLCDVIDPPSQIQFSDKDSQPSTSEETGNLINGAESTSRLDTADLNEICSSTCNDESGEIVYEE